MSVATLDELGLAAPAADDEGQAVSVLWRPGAVDPAEWPTSGPWSKVLRDLGTGESVPVLGVPHLTRNMFHRLLCIAQARGLLNAGEMHLGMWLQEDDGPRPRIGPGGVLAWHHRDMTDFAQHYADYTDTGSKPKKCTTTMFWIRLRTVRELGLVFHVERACRGVAPRYVACLRADSPLLRNLPEDLARLLHLDRLARLLGEFDVPEPAEADSALSRIVEAYGGAQLPPAQATDAAALSVLGKQEIALLHAASREQEETVVRLALAASRGWADADARPAGDAPVLSQRPSPAPQARQELAIPGRPMPAALKDHLARLVGIKRAVIRGVELATLGPLALGSADGFKTVPITEKGLSPFGLSSEVSREVTSREDDGRTKGKAAPTARTTNGGAAFGLAAWGRPVAEEPPVPALRGPLRGKFTQAELDEAERVARQVWAIFRDRRPTQTLLGQWVTGPDGLAVWEAGEGWETLIRLIARCLRRFAASAVIEHAAASVSVGVREPVKVLCYRLWKSSRSLDAYTYRRDRSRPASYVLEDQELSGREQGRRYNERRTAAYRLANPHLVPAGESSAEAELRENQERARRASERWREQAQAPIPVKGKHREWVDGPAADQTRVLTAQEIEAGLGALAPQEPERDDPFHISPQAARKVAREISEARAMAKAAPAPAEKRLTAEQNQERARAKRDADREAEAVRTPAQQAARAALRRALGKE